MTENQENSTNSECLNCHQQLPAGASFCPNCGQKNTDGLITLKEFFQNFLDNVFNINARLFQTLRWLCIPAKLTKEYFKGKHKSYYHPIRLYLVLSIIFFTILNFVSDSNDLVTTDFGGDKISLEDQIAKEAHQIAFLEEIDTLSEQIVLFQDTTAKAALAALKARLSKSIEKDSFNIIVLWGEERHFDYADIVTLSGKELVEKYEVKGFWAQITTKQMLHFLHDQTGFTRQLVNNIPLMVLAMMPFLALFMKLLYIRNNRYYVEHLVLNFHHHAFAFFILSLLAILPRGLMELALIPVVITIFVFLYLTMKRYYGQGRGKTFLKFMAFNFFYLFSFLIVLLITLIISFLLF